MYNFREIQVGNNVFIGDRTVIEGIVPVKIGNNVMFGPEVMIRGGDHNFSIVGKPMFEIKLGGVNLPIIIEDDTWIGARVIILKGVTISEGSVIGAGALVNKNTLPYSINVGVPSRPIKCRFNCNELQKHLVEVRSSYSFEHILRIYSDNNISIVNEK